MDYYEARGFTFSLYQDDDLYTLSLTVNATLSNNNTVLRCHALLNTRGATSIISDIVILQIVSGMCVCAVYGYTCTIHSLLCTNISQTY